jgi:hypothetical protein
MDAQHTSGPLSIIAVSFDGQFAVESDMTGKSHCWNEAYVCFSGYFGSYGPEMFAAAPKLLAAAQRLAARGFFTPTTCADKATQKDMASMLDAIAKATGATE